MTQKMITRIDIKTAYAIMIPLISALYSIIGCILADFFEERTDYLIISFHPN